MPRVSKKQTQDMATWLDLQAARKSCALAAQESGEAAQERYLAGVGEIPLEALHGVLAALQAAVNDLANMGCKGG